VKRACNLFDILRRVSGQKPSNIPTQSKSFNQQRQNHLLSFAHKYLTHTARLKLLEALTLFIRFSARLSHASCRMVKISFTAGTAPAVTLSSTHMKRYPNIYPSDSYHIVKVTKGFMSGDLSIFAQVSDLPVHCATPDIACRY